VHLGIDIGTTRTKATLVSSSGNWSFTSTIATPQGSNGGIIPLGIVWRTVLSVATSAALKIPKFRVSSIAISAQCLTLCRFDRERPTEGVAISYLRRAAMLRRGELGGRARLMSAKGATTYKSIWELDRRCDSLGVRRDKRSTGTLTSYINYCLSGRLSLDPISLWESGIPKEDIAGVFPNTSILGAVDRLGVCNSDSPFHGAILASGTTDSVASYYGASDRPGFAMIYAGTWGSVFTTPNNTREIVSASPLLPPYRWAVSVANFGQDIEALARGANVRVSTLLNYAATSRLKHIRRKSRPSRKTDSGDLTLIATATNLAIKKIADFAKRARGVAIRLQRTKTPLVITGGLAESEAFCLLFRSLLGVQLNRSSIVHGSFGTALIAAHAVGIDIQRSPEQPINESNPIEA